MNLHKLVAVLGFFLVAGVLAGGSDAAANGTIRATFKYADGGGGEQALSGAYLYLQDGTTIPPLEKFYKSADYIFGPSSSQGIFNASVPAGIYYVRLTKRNPTSGNNSPLGPPEGGDFTWTNYQQITVTDNTVTDLGTQYATLFGQPITITGVVVDRSTDEPMPGRYVRAQPEPCIEAEYWSDDPSEWVDSNECGPVKYMAQQRTDAQGRYTLLLKEPGTYYIVTSRKLGDHHKQYIGNRDSTGFSTGPITVNNGDNIILGDIRVPYPY
jgi:hypothetical protein